ncbi:hypothetical protein AWZ03_005554 [Drosophila navojoa]|uniref:Uncharacterized protein n=1 Tax=Drosophila navojoa TaxID=7232 RepID=A0A484BH95_DRONA|nr:hypothetical protein AWZ03_005554 [Drosophila navojoa]
MANSRQETEKMMAGCAGGGMGMASGGNGSGGVGVGGGGSHEGSITLSPVNGQNATLMRHSPDIKKHPQHAHPYDNSHMTEDSTLPQPSTSAKAADGAEPQPQRQRQPQPAHQRISKC